MTTYERRQRLLSLLREQPGIRTTEMARLLAVSKGTIRNDLCALEEEGALSRVRGGGVLKLDSAAGSSAFARRALANQTEFIDQTALPGVTYSYRVIVFNAAGEVMSLSTLESLPRFFLPILRK